MRYARAAAVLLAAASLVVDAKPAGKPVVDAAADAEQAKLVQDLDAALTESAAEAVLEPYMDKLKTLKPAVIEKVVMRQWWTLARELVTKSHKQSVDLSFAVRKAVKALKEEADELLRNLNPKYGQAQQVAPAFQWAQNDTCVLMTIKYTVRWNAPGALEVTEPNVNMTGNVFNFSGLGKHSNNKYKYWLSLNLFDHIDGDISQWSTASVGKLSVTLKKKWARKWPRLLANKKTKIGNMHLWSERQESLDDTLSGMSTVSNSPVTCKTLDKLYCLATDTCKKPDSCSQCPGKSVPILDENICTGTPSEKASLTFKDSDMDENEVGGEIKITKARNDFDIDKYDIYWGKDDKSRLELLEGQAPKIASVMATGADGEFKLSQNTKIPEGATHLLVYSVNKHGEFASPGSVLVSDAVLPKGKPSSIQFHDEDGDKGEVGGTVTIGKADDMNRVDEFSLHWGRSERRKISSGSLIRDIRKTDKDVTHRLAASTKIPDGATHLLAYTKNPSGENPSAVSLKLVDHVKPCIGKEDSPDCPAGLTVSPDLDKDEKQAKAEVVVDRAETETGLSHYALYWGRQSCQPGNGQSGVKNGHIFDIPVKTDDQSPLKYEMAADTPVPMGSTHVVVFTKSAFGESDSCRSTEFKDLVVKDGAEL